MWYMIYGWCCDGVGVCAGGMGGDVVVVRGWCVGQCGVGMPADKLVT